jgi:hypothetical protein
MGPIRRWEDASGGRATHLMVHAASVFFSFVALALLP